MNLETQVLTAVVEGKIGLEQLAALEADVTRRMGAFHKQWGGFLAQFESDAKLVEKLQTDYQGLLDRLQILAKARFYAVLKDVQDGAALDSGPPEAA